MKKLQLTTNSEEETFHLGATLGKMLRSGNLVLLSGELGAGKTRIAKGIISAATGIDPDEVVSPTFTLINCFEGPFQVCHADLYRIDYEQVDGLGLEDALDDGAALIVEWAEKLPDFHKDPLIIFISYCQAQNQRLFHLEWLETGIWNELLETKFKKCGE